MGVWIGFWVSGLLRVLPGEYILGVWIARCTPWGVHFGCLDCSVYSLGSTFWVSGSCFGCLDRSVYSLGSHFGCLDFSLVESYQIDENTDSAQACLLELFSSSSPARAPELELRAHSKHLEEMPESSRRAPRETLESSLGTFEPQVKFRNRLRGVNFFAA